MPLISSPRFEAWIALLDAYGAWAARPIRLPRKSNELRRLRNCPRREVTPFRNGEIKFHSSASRVSP